MDYIHHYRFDSDTRVIFELLIKDLRRNGVQVTVFIPPYQNDAYKLFNSRADTAQSLRSFREDFSQFTKKFNLTLFDYLDPESLDCAGDQFMDMVHPVGHCLEAVVS